MIRSGSAAVLAVLLVASAAQAQAPKTVDPPAPADPGDMRAVYQWSLRAGVTNFTPTPSRTSTDYWNSLGADAVGVHMARSDLGRSGQDIVRVTVRLERFAPIADDRGSAVRSETTAYDLDCKGSRFKPVSSTTYFGHSLTGPDRSQEVKREWRPVAEDKLLTQTYASICAAEKRGPQSAPPPRFP